MPNFNDKIRVRLTVHGINTYERYLKRQEAMIPDLMEQPKYREALYATFNQSLGGKPVEFHLWQFMNIFGEFFYNGADNVVVDNYFALAGG